MSIHPFRRGLGAHRVLQTNLYRIRAHRRQGTGAAIRIAAQRGHAGRPRRYSGPSPFRPGPSLLNCARRFVGARKRPGLATQPPL